MRPAATFLAWIKVPRHDCAVSRTPPIFVSSLALTIVLASGCSLGESTERPRPSAQPLVPGCGPASSVTKNPGYLTLATERPAYLPWFADDDPLNGEGYEGAVARGVAERLGYSPEQVRFIDVGFADALAAGPKGFDVAINQFTISPERRASVDFSSPYYTVAHAVIAMRGNPAAEARSIADLTPLRLGAIAQTTNLDAITSTVHAEIPPVVFADTEESRQALTQGRVDAIVVDLPTGLQMTKDIPQSVAVGQFSRSPISPDRFGLVLEKNSQMTTCVSIAVEKLYAEGVLDALAGTWITSTAGVRVLD